MNEVLAPADETEAEILGSHVVHEPRFRWRAAGEAVVLYAGSIAVALGLATLLVTTTGGSATQVLSALLDGAVRSPGAWGITLSAAAPLLIVAVGTIVATRAGLVNIGQEGQLLVGAGVAAFAAVRLPGPGFLVLVAALALGAVGGAAWAGLAALLRYWRGVPEVISTLLLVFVAFQVVTFAITSEGLLGDRSGRMNRVNTGEQLPADTLLPAPEIFGNTVDLGVVLAVMVAIGIAFLLARTVWGFRLRTLGLNARAAQRAGVRASRVGSLALAASGAMAGLAGATMLTGTSTGDRITLGFSDNVGWEGLLVALVARDRAVAAVPVAIAFAMLRTGSGFLAATGVERRITDVVQALLVLALLAPPAVLFLRERMRAMAATRSRV